jgi:hypothetical protein
MAAPSRVEHRPEALDKIDPSAAEAADRLMHEFWEQVPIWDIPRVVYHPRYHDLVHQVYAAWTAVHPDYHPKRYIRGNACTACLPELALQARERLDAYYAYRTDLTRAAL